MPNNGDTDREFRVGTDKIRGLGSFHKTLPHNEYGEVNEAEFIKLVDATHGDGSGFAVVCPGVQGYLASKKPKTAAFTNPQGGLASDQLTHHPASYSMPPAPTVLSKSTAVEMTELYWMALTRDVAFDEFHTNPCVSMAAKELNQLFKDAVAETKDPGHLKAGIDLPGAEGKLAEITPQNLFRLGLPGEDVGPFVSQFFLRNAAYGTQTIDAKIRPYKKERNYLTSFDKWLAAQNSGRDQNGQDYSQANEDSKDNFELNCRFISTPRDLARFVNKDALHQAYFNATIILLSGGASWTPGNPYADMNGLGKREAGFGVLGGPHILALVSEVATRALKVIWSQKWQVNLRLRPEAYGGLVHVQNLGSPLMNNGKRPYGLPSIAANSKAAKKVKGMNDGTLLLPMAFTPGSPTHPSYGAGHATVAGACVTVLKAFFQTFETVTQNGKEIDAPIRFVYDEVTNPKGLQERSEPYGPKCPIKTWIPGVKVGKNKEPDEGTLTPLDDDIVKKLTIEGELNKLAMNVAMGRSIGGVHWRSDNTRSLILGEALAAEILADITTDANEKPCFEFRSFARKADGTPKKVRICEGRIYVDGVLVDTHGSAL